MEETIEVSNTSNNDSDLIALRINIIVWLLLNNDNDDWSADTCNIVIFIDLRVKFRFHANN